MKFESKYTVTQDEYLNAKLVELIKLAQEKRESEPSDAIKQAEEGIIIAKQLDDYKALLRLLSIVASSKAIQGHFEEAKEACNKVLELGELFNVTEHKTTALHVLGYSYARRGLYQIALEYYYQAVQINLQKKDYKKLCENYNNIATIYKRINQLDKSLSYLEKSLEFYIKSGNELPYHYMANKAGILGVMKKYDEAIALLHELLALIEGNPEQRFMEMSCYFGLANQYSYKKDVVNATIFFEKGIALAEECNYRELLIRLLYRYAGMLFELGKVEETIIRLEGALKHCHEQDNQVLQIDCLTLLHKCYEAVEDYTKSNKCLQDLVILQKDYYQNDRDLKILQIEQTKQAEIQTLISKNEEIERKNILLEQSIKQLKQYAYIVAHDLKQPLRSINGFAQLIGKNLNAEKIENPDIDSYINHLSSSTNYLNDLLEDLLQYATLEEFTNFDTHINLNDILKEVLSGFKGSDAEVTFDKLPIVKVSKIHMSLLFQNIIDNAIKFKNQATSPIVHISVVKDKDKHVFSIKDNGIGIALPYHEKIFNVFYRIEKDKEGTGIGLAICDKIIDLYEGKIWIESEVGKGSIFKFTLPINGLV